MVVEKTATLVIYFECNERYQSHIDQPAASAVREHHQQRAHER
jgi:hypothetical protein